MPLVGSSSVARSPTAHPIDLRCAMHDVSAMRTDGRVETNDTYNNKLQITRTCTVDSQSGPLLVGWDGSNHDRIAQNTTRE
jgi:hypothetical protein